MLHEKALSMIVLLCSSSPEAVVSVTEMSLILVEVFDVLRNGLL